MKKPWTLGEKLEEFENQEWGTHDMAGIKEKIREEEWSDAQKRMTGMEEEQADWEGGGDDGQS